MKKREAQNSMKLRLALLASALANIILVAGIGIYLLATTAESPVDRYNRTLQEYEDLCARPEVLDQAAKDRSDGSPTKEAQARAWISFDCGERAQQGAYAADLNKELRLRGLPPLDE